LYLKFYLFSNNLVLLLHFVQSFYSVIYEAHANVGQRDLGAVAPKEKLKLEERHREKMFDVLVELYAEKIITPHALVCRSGKLFEKWTTLIVRDFTLPEQVRYVDQSDDEGSDYPISDEEVDWSDDDQDWGEPDTTPRRQAALATMGK
jgi:hypothetical protein